MRRPPLTLQAAAALLTAGAAFAAWKQLARADDFIWILLWLPLASLALLKRSRVAWGLLLLLSFHLAAFGAVIALHGALRGGSEPFVDHFRVTALFWLALGALLSARPTRHAVWTRA